MQTVATIFKVLLLLLCEGGAFPIFCGIILDLATLDLFGATIEQRLTFMRVAPLSFVVLHWLAGLLLMLLLSLLHSVLREVLHYRVLWFLQSPDEVGNPSFNDVLQELAMPHLIDLGASALFYIPLLAVLVWLPVQLNLSICPWIFPLNTSFSDPLSEVPIDLLLFHICAPLTIEYCNPRSALRGALSALLFHVAELWSVTADVFPEDADDSPLVATVAPLPAPCPPSARWRVGGFVISMIATTIVLVTYGISLPIVLGRGLLHLCGLPIAHDIYTFAGGAYALGACIATIHALILHLEESSLASCVVSLVGWVRYIMVMAVLGIMWVVAIPLLIGLLLEFSVIVHFRVPLYQSPCSPLHQDWALGLLLLKLWVRLVLMGGPSWCPVWCAKFQQVRNNGFANFNGQSVLCGIIAPILIQLLLLLCGPYVLAKVVSAYLLGLDSITSMLAMRLSYVALAALYALSQAVVAAEQLLGYVHDRVRDNKYLVGRRLHNFEVGMERHESIALGVEAPPSFASQYSNGDQ